MIRRLRALLPKPRFLTERAAIARQGLFDPAAYRRAYGLRGIAARRPFLHYCLVGERQGRRPNPFFDPRHYAAQLSAAGLRAGGTLLGHYALHGTAEGPAPSAEFDSRWYAWEYMGGGAAPPLGHFMAVGLRAGHRPAPSVDLDDWLAARGATRADASALLLDEVARTGGLAGLGAADWEAGLRAAQARFRDAIELRVLRRAAPGAANLVLVQSGRSARLPWLTRPRRFDVLRNYYEEPEGPPCADSDHVIVQRGTKTTAVATLLARDPDLLLAYDHVLLLDDDIEIGTADIERLFDEMAAHGLALAQPLLTPDSQTVWRTLRDPGNRGRIVPVTSVEVMMPAFSRDALRSLAWTFDEAVSGFGVDLLWGTSLPEAREQGRIAVVGTVCARHARPIDEAGGAFYRAMAAQGISPRLELWRLMSRHGVRAELRALEAPPASGKPGPTAMRIALVTMVRNEADILPGFLAHAGALFDRILVVDHNSADGSSEILDAAASRLPLSVWRLRSRAYQQAAVLTGLAHRAFAEGADWVLVLDADEFLEVPDREALEAMLAGARGEVAELTWRNAVRLGDWPFGATDLGGEYACALDEPPYGKVAIPRAFADRYPGFVIAMGGHSVAPRPGAPAAATARIGRLRHLPIRSLSQLAGKLACGVAACRAHRSLGGGEAVHWFRMADLMERGALDASTVRRAALRYGEPLHEALSAAAEPASCTERWAPRQISLDLPRGLADPDAIATREADLRWRPSPNTNDRWLMLDLSTRDAALRPKVLDALGNPGPERFGRLAEERLPEPLASGIFAPEQVANLLDLLCTPMTTPVPSAWVQHGPVMLALMALLRPRRYAELGSHCGYSFFAACQGAAASRTGTECVALDTWQGDHQAGHYGDEVYETFLSDLRRNHAGPYFHIRALFDEAADCFEEGSLDLLLIDGLHTFEAVSHDFETWLPKMSSRGVILFHDTTVHDHDFGVWRLWERISGAYPSFNLLHGHGLGMVYVGKPEPALAGLLRTLTEDAGQTLMMRSLLRGIGKLSAEVSDTRRMRDSCSAELGAMKRSLSWRVTGPLRVAARQARRFMR